MLLYPGGCSMRREGLRDADLLAASHIHAAASIDPTYVEFLLSSTFGGLLLASISWSLCVCFLTKNCICRAWFLSLRTSSFNRSWRSFSWAASSFSVSTVCKRSFSLLYSGTPCTLPHIPARLYRRRWTAKEEYGELRIDAFLVQVLLAGTIAKVGRFFVAPSAASLCPFNMFSSGVLVHEEILPPLHHGILDVVL